MKIEKTLTITINQEEALFLANAIEVGKWKEGSVQQDFCKNFESFLSSFCEELDITY